MKLPRRAVITYAATAAAAAAGVVAGGGVASAQSAYVANVMAHGAVGDGVTDDTDAFQAAIDAIAGAGGGRLVIPPNTYVLAPGDPYHGIMLRADNMTVTATGATFVRPTESYGAVFGASTRDGEPVGYGSGLRNLDWTGGRFLGSISDGNFVPGFSLHHPQHCTFRGITFENCLARASHMFDIVGAEDITIEDCRFLGQESPTDDKAYAEAIQIGESYRGGLSRPVPDVGFSGLMCRDITVRDCEFLPHDGQAGPTPFGFHSGVEGKHHERLRFLENLVVDPRTAILPPNSPRSSANLGAVHLSDARDVTIVGNTFRQTTGRITRAIALVGYEYGILASTEPAQAARGLFAVPQGPAHVRIEQNTFIGFPATAAHDTVFVRSWPGTTAPGVVIRNNKFRQGHTSDIADPGAAIGVGNLDHPDISGNTITGHYLGIDLSGSSVAGGTVAGNRISNTGDTEFPAAITVDPGVTDTAISGTISSGYTHVVAGTPGTGTTVIG